MKLRKAMAVALAGALVLTTAVTGTTSEAAKKTKLKTKKVTIFVKGKKKISITGKKAKHKYTFTSQKKKIAKVSKKGVITGVKAGKTTITVKDTWKQKGKKKTKKLGTVKVTVKKKTIVKTPVPPVQTPVATPAQTPVVTPAQTPVVTPAQTPVVTPPVQPPVVTPPVQTPDGGSQTTAPTTKPTTKPTAAPTEKPVPTPEVEMTLAKHTIAEESTTTAEVSVSAGEVKDVTWSVGDTTIATAAKDEADAKKAAITGVAPGKTKVTADVKVTVEGKEFTVKAEQELTVAAKDALIVNASIESAPAEVIVGQTADLKVTADVGEIQNVVWAVEGDAATIETDSVEAVKAVLKTVKVGEVTVSATVTVKDGDKTATDTAKATIKVIKDPTDIIEIDITKNISVAGYGKPASYEVQGDGTVKCTWAADADNYTFVKFKFDGMDLTNYYCVIDAEGPNMNVDIQDAVRKEPDWGNPYAVVAPQYGKAFPFQIQLTEDNYNSVKDQEGKAPDYTNVGGVNIYKGTQSEEFVLIVKSIKFYKYEEDIPK